MKVLILNNRTEIVQQSARVLASRIRASKHFVLGLGTGATVLSICEELAALSRAEGLSLAHVTAFHAGEYLGISHRDPSAYNRLIKENFFSLVDIPSGQIFSLNGESSNLDQECADYEAAIQSEGGLDFFLGSLGKNGNLAFNEPGSSLRGRTRLKTLHAETIKADARFFGGNEALVPTQALTIGLQTIFEAKEVLIAVYGVDKAFAVQSCIEEPLGAAYPASILQQHPKTIMMVDKVAARYLDEVWRSQQETLVNGESL